MTSLAWWILVKAVRLWGTRYLDQWDKFKFQTKYGWVYVTIGREDPYPDSFDAITSSGRPLDCSSKRAQIHTTE
jgi:hypothetical protein